MSHPQPAPDAQQPKTMGLTGCTNCIVFEHCGGHPKPVIYQAGCANFAATTKPKDTDDMNPHFEEQFWKLWNDVEGLHDYKVGKLRPINPAGLPRYIPVLQGRHLRPTQPLDQPVIALPLFHVVGRRKDGSYGPKFSSAAALRVAYKLRKDTRVLLIGVDHDPPLETFWAKHSTNGVCRSLARLGLEITVPNFSFFTCVPRFQILRNRKRILLTAARLSEAGVRVSPHLNANTPGDWAFWLKFLEQHPEVATVTMEFQTGARRDKAFGDEAFNSLASTVKALRRPIHCLLVGAARYYKAACDHLPAFTVIDSVPFMYAQKRHVLVKTAASQYVLRPVQTQKLASLQALFESTLQHYEAMLSKSPGKPRSLPKQCSAQAEFLY